MKKHGNFHFPTRLKISYIINSLKDLCGIFWRMMIIITDNWRFRGDKLSLSELLVA